MAFRIDRTAAVAFSKDTAPVKSKSYLAWVHELPCVVTGRRPVEAAHVSYANPAFGAMGRGKGQKASDRWALPLHPEIHAAQHKHGNEREWWLMQGINPHMIASILWGLWKERGADATAQAEQIILSRAFITEIYKEAGE